MIIGTRPEAIKMAPIVQILKTKSDRWECSVIATAQHRELLDQVLSTFDIEIDRDLDIMTKGQTIGQVTERAMRGLGEVFEKESPDIVIVQGDTTTTFCGALAAFYQKIPVAHVEAGLRTDQKYSPFPEEMNRRLTTRLSDLHFAPTERSKLNMLNEGVHERDILVTGNTVIDALLSVAGQEEPDPATDVDVSRDSRQRLILVTLHRRESFGRPLENILRALSAFAKAYPQSRIVYPVHPNPHVKTNAAKFLGGLSNVELVAPVDYRSFIRLLKRAHFVITDSGGVQEEAPSLGVPVLVTRDVTERPEAIEAGAARLVGSDEQRILGEARKLMDESAHYRAMSQAVNPYGDGRAAERIEARLGQYFWPERGCEMIEPFSWRRGPSIYTQPGKRVPRGP